MDALDEFLAAPHDLPPMFDTPTDRATIVALLLVWSVPFFLGVAALGMWVWA